MIRTSRDLNTQENVWHDFIKLLRGISCTSATVQPPGPSSDMGLMFLRASMEKMKDDWCDSNNLSFELCTGEGYDHESSNH